MAKQLKTPHKALMAAWAVIVTLTLNLGVALAQPSIVDKAKKKLHDAKEGIKEGADLIDKAGEAKRHTEQFVSSTGPLDFIGRSFQQTLVICLVGLGVTLVWYRFKRTNKTSARYWMELAFSYIIGVGAGWGFELLRSSGRWNKECASLLMLAFLILGAGMLLHLPRVWVMIKAIKYREFRYWLRTWELPPWITGEAPVPAEGPAMEEESEEEDSATEEESEEEPPEEEADASSAIPTCPSCGQEAEPGAKFCGYCTASLSAPATTASRTCPSCGQEAEPGAKFCGYCTARL